MAATSDEPRFGRGEVIRRLDDGTKATVITAGPTTYLLRIDGRRSPALLNRGDVETEWGEVQL